MFIVHPIVAAAANPLLVWHIVVQVGLNGGTTKPASGHSMLHTEGHGVMHICRGLQLVGGVSCIHQSTKGAALAVGTRGICGVMVKLLDAF